METLNILYIFRFPGGREESYALNLDAHTLDLLDQSPDKPPPWTRLDFHQCPNCPLSVDTHPHCPLAVGLENLVTRCKTVLSYDRIHIDVITPERTMSGDTTSQRGISSLMGLITATSGCPHAGFFKPMARFHLPLASEEETIYRAAAMYLLAQYFLRKQGRQADLELGGLKAIYDNIHTVNIAMAERLRSASDEDATVNAVILLDIFAKALPYTIEDSLEDIRYLFTHFLE